MIDTANFKDWLVKNTTYTPAVISDVISRVKRADSILEWDGRETYQFYLEKQPDYCKLSVSVRSQIKKAVKHYSDFSKI